MPRFVKETQVSTVWRFYVDQHRKWRWQRLTTGQVVISESPTGYKDYEECLVAAQRAGHVFQSAQPKKSNTQGA